MQEKGLPDVIGTEFPLELPIFISYRPSMRVCLFNTLAHVGAVFCLVLADLPLLVAGLTGTAVLSHYLFYLRRFFRVEDICFKLDKQDRWQLLQEHRDAVDLELLPGALAHPHLVILCFKEPTGKTCSCVLTHDNLDAQTLRRLRVRLRWPYK